MRTASCSRGRIAGSSPLRSPRQKVVCTPRRFFTHADRCGASGFRDREYDYDVCDVDNDDDDNVDDGDGDDDERRCGLDGLACIMV